MSESHPQELSSVSAKPFAIEDVPWEEWSQGVRFGSRYRALGKFAGSTHVGVSIEELPPGKQSCPLHWHTLEEEHMWFLEGRATLRLGDARHPVQAGDYVCFPAGRREGHALVNDSDAPCRFLIIGERNPNDVCVYPDSKKIYVRSSGDIYPLSAKVDYWDGENEATPPG